MSNEQSAPAGGTAAGKTEASQPKDWLRGNLTADPRLNKTRDGTPILNFRIAVNHGQGEEKTTTYHNVAAFGKEAQAVSATLKKGDHVRAVGRLADDSYEKDGVTHEAQKLNSDTVQRGTYDKDKKEWNWETVFKREPYKAREADKSQESPAQEAGGEQDAVAERDDEQDLGR